jgi:hypothetical protein
MEKIETRGRPRNPKFTAICQDVLTKVKKLGKDECITMTVPQIKTGGDCRRLRESLDYKELRICLLGKGFSVKLFCHKKRGASILSISR